MKNFYDEAINDIIDLFMHSSLKFLSRDVIDILKNLYANGLNEKVYISEINNSIHLYISKNDRELKIIVSEKDIITNTYDGKNLIEDQYKEDNSLVGWINRGDKRKKHERTTI